MTFKSFDRVHETTTTTGTGNITLAGAVSGNIAFTTRYATSVVFHYAIVLQNGAEWEIGIGHLSGATTLVRDGVLASSNSNAAVSFSAGTKDVFVAAPGAETNAFAFLFFGDGTDGDVVVSSGTTTLARDMFYRNLTISGTGSIDPAGYRIFVSGILDLTAAPANAIARNGGDGGLSTTTGGTAGAVPAGVHSVAGAGSAGTVGTAGVAAAAPTNATAATGVSAGNGGSGGAGGTGGFDSGAAGATGGGGGATASPMIMRRAATQLAGPFTASTMITGGCGGGGGGGARGRAGQTATGGGGGGAGAGIIAVFARIVSRGSSTVAGAISAVGGAGGQSGNSATTASGGGGGGGGGGWVYLLFEALVGSAKAGAVKASGGSGGNGGTAGAGSRGGGGVGGTGGRVTLVNLGAGTISETAGTGGGAASGATGGTGESISVTL